MSSETEHLLRVVGDSSSGQQSLQELAEKMAEVAREGEQLEQGLQRFEAIMRKAAEGTKALSREEQVVLANSKELGRALDQATRENQRAHDTIVRTARRAADDQIREQKRVENEHGQSVRRMAQMGAQGLGLGGVSTALAGGGAAIGALAAGMAIKNAIEDMLKYTDAVKLVAQTTGESARESSTMLAVAQRLGVEYEKMSQALLHVNQVAISSPQQFSALGIALQDSSGKVRSSLDIFEDLRNVFAALPDNAAKSALAAELFGSAWRDILPWLTASESEIAKLRDEVQKSALVMDADGIQKADAWKKSLAELGTMTREVGVGIAGVLLPAVLELAQGWKTNFDRLGEFLNKLGELKDHIAMRIGRGPELPSSEARREGGRDTRSAEEGAADTRAAEALRRNIAEATNLRRQQTAEVIAQLREQDRAKHDGMQRELELERRNATATIQSIQDEQRARNEAYAERVEQLREESEAVLEALDVRRQAIQDEQEAFEVAQRAQVDVLEAQRRTAQDVFDAVREQRQAAIEAINAESEALNEQYRLRQETRSAAVAALRDQMRATDDLLRVERMRKDLADAEHDLLVQKSIEVYRRKNETEEEYQERVFERNKRVREAEESAANARVDIERETAKKAIEERIRALEAMGRADSEQHTAALRRNETRIQGIRDTMEVEARAHRDFLRAVEQRADAIRREGEANAARTKARLLEVDALAKAERGRAKDAIEDIQKRQAEQNKADEAYMRDIQRVMTLNAQKSADSIRDDNIATKKITDNLAEVLKAAELAATAKGVAEAAAAKVAGDAWVEAYRRAREAAGGGAGSGGGGTTATPVATGGGRPTHARAASAGIPVPLAVGFANPNPVGSPAYYAAIAKQFAVEAGIDPAIFANQMYHESGMNPNARGAAGEVGIAQFMPGTAASWGVTDRSDPIQSLRGAANYMRSALVQSGGDYSKALAMYNGGFGYAASPGRSQAEGYARTVLNMNVYGLTAEEAAAIVAARVGREMDAQARAGAGGIS